jgi:hypothetical protein
MLHYVNKNIHSYISVIIRGAYIRKEHHILLLLLRGEGCRFWLLKYYLSKNVDDINLLNPTLYSITTKNVDAINLLKILLYSVTTI